MPHTAMVMAAGLGTRMRPLTLTLPKPLVPVAGIALIDRALDWLAAAGVRRAVVNSYYLAEQLEAHLAQRGCPQVVLSREQSLLETGGGIKHALATLGDTPFFCINSDVICLDGEVPALTRLAEAWDEQAMDALLLVHKVEAATGYTGNGDFFLEKDGLLRRRDANGVAPYVFTGVQLLHSRLFAHAPDGAFSLNILYNRQRRADGTLPRIYGLAHDGHWLHVGDKAGLAQAEAFLLQTAL